MWYLGFHSYGLLSGFRVLRLREPGLPQENWYRPVLVAGLDLAVGLDPVVDWVPLADWVLVGSWALVNWKLAEECHLQIAVVVS